MSGADTAPAGEIWVAAGWAKIPRTDGGAPGSLALTEVWKVCALVEAPTVIAEGAVPGEPTVLSPSVPLFPADTTTTIPSFVRFSRTHACSSQGTLAGCLQASPVSS